MYTRILKFKPIKLFDVTLRDGLQSIPKIYTLKEKEKLFDTIVTHRCPSSMEIGSIVSPNILPQMQNSLELFQYANSFKSCFSKPFDIYMLTPNTKSLDTAIKHNVENFSFITSVSSAFQKKNINKSLDETKKEIEKMMELVVQVNDHKVKLYISCITECPVKGQLELQKIIDEILFYYYSYEHLNEICLSDTCGTLQFHDFKYILDELNKRNIDMDKLSLHLHNQSDKQNIKNIILYAMKMEINKFDVSYMPDIGGCSVTMKETHGNLGYEQIYECM